MQLDFTKAVGEKEVLVTFDMPGDNGVNGVFVPRRSVDFVVLTLWETQIPSLPVGKDG